MSPLALRDTCPNLAAEGSLYAYDPDEQVSTETPVDRDNYALSALHYLVMGLAKRGPKAKATDTTAVLIAPARASGKTSKSGRRFRLGVSVD